MSRVPHITHDIMSGEPHFDYAYAAHPGAMNGFIPAPHEQYTFGLPEDDEMTDESFNFINNLATVPFVQDEPLEDIFSFLDPSTRSFLAELVDSPLPSLPQSQPPHPTSSRSTPLSNSRIPNVRPAAPPLHPLPPAVQKAPVIPPQATAPLPQRVPTSAPLPNTSTSAFLTSDLEDAQLFTESRKGSAVKKPQYKLVAEFLDNQRREEQRFLIGNGISANGLREFATGLSRRRNSTRNPWNFFMKSEVATRILEAKGKSAKPVKGGKRATQYAKMFAKLSDTEEAELKAEMEAAELKMKEDLELVGLEIHGEHRQTRITDVEAYEAKLREEAQIMHLKHGVHTLTLVSSSHVLDAKSFWVTSLGGTAFLHTFNYDATLLTQRFTALCVTGATVNLQQEARLDESQLMDLAGLNVGKLRSMLSVLFRDIFNTALAAHNIRHGIPAVTPAKVCTYSGLASLGMTLSLSPTSGFTAHDYRNPAGYVETPAKGNKPSRGKLEAMSALDLNRIIRLVRAGALQFTSLEGFTPRSARKRSHKASSAGATSGKEVPGVEDSGRRVLSAQTVDSEDEEDDAQGTSRRQRREEPGSSEEEEQVS
ncbi:hypothetical protein P7C70_g5449, partial [Phenoliferia sp. Uapishka_3]